jgi:hypothetical protein
MKYSHMCMSKASVFLVAFLMSLLVLCSCSSIEAGNNLTESEKDQIALAALEFGLGELSKYPNPPSIFCVDRGQSEVAAERTWSSREVRQLAKTEPLPAPTLARLHVVAASPEDCAAALETNARELRIGGRPAAKLAISKLHRLVLVVPTDEL